MSSLMIIQANSKINLGLEVSGLRPDGFHDIRTVMVKIRLADRVALDLQPSLGPGKLDVTVSGLRAPEGESNIAHTAAASYLTRAGYACSSLPFDLSVHIHKAIPAGAGLGGGSSNAAATISGLAALLQSTGSRPGPLRQPDCEAVARETGSDVPFFLAGPVCLAEGRGERLTQIESRCHLHLLLAKPAASLSTKLVYQMYDMVGTGARPDIPAVIQALSRGDTRALRDAVNNDLEKAAVGLAPDIARVITLLRGLEPVCTGMTGSGSCVYAVFDDEMQARHARMEVSRNRWVSWSVLTDSFSGEVHDNET